MKKALSLLLAFATACSISVATFAADDNDPGVVRFSDDTRNTDIGTFALTIGTSIRVGGHELYLVQSGKVIGGLYNKLDPDEEYKFRLYYNDSANPIVGTDADLIAAGRELTGADVNKGNIRLRTITGSTNIQSAKIKTVGRGVNARYDLVINTRANYGTKISDVEYSLNVTGTDVTVPFVESTHAFEVGYATISDDETDIGEGGTLTISNDYPVVTKDQFSDIARSSNYKPITIEGEDGGWSFKGRVSGMPDTNFFYNYDVVPDIVNRFPDQDYKFLSFKAGVTFPASGEMRIDVSDVYDTFDNLYVYLYRNGRLTRIDSTYDSGATEVVFRTNYLGAFVITDTEITDTTILNDRDEETSPEPIEDEDINNNVNNNNPATGADGTMSVALTLGLVSLVTASAISRKKK